MELVQSSIAPRVIHDARLYHLTNEGSFHDRCAGQTSPDWAADIISDGIVKYLVM